MHFLRDCLLLVKMKFALVGLALGISLSGHLAWPQTQVPQKPKPDDVTQFIHVEPEALGEWVQQEFEDLGHVLNITYRDEPSRDEFAYFYEWTDPNAHQAEAGYQSADLIFEDCSTETESQAWACEIARLQMTVINYSFCDGQSLFSSFSPIPLGFRIYEDQPWCVIELATLLTAEGPLLLIENIEWMVEVSHRLKNPAALNPTPIIKGYQNPKTWKDIERRWRQLEQFSTLEPDALPKTEELVPFDRANEKFNSALDRFAHYRLDPLDFKYDDHHWGYVILEDTPFMLGVSDCEAPTCKVVQLYYAADSTDATELQKIGESNLAYQADGGGIVMYFMVPQRGASPALIKALLARFVSLIEPIASNYSESDWTSVDDGWEVTIQDVEQEQIDCWDVGKSTPQFAYLKNKQGQWINASPDCPPMELRSGYLSAEISQLLLRKYLEGLDKVFDSDAWDGIAGVLFISDPSMIYPAFYKTPGGDFFPSLVFNFSLEPDELESPYLFLTITHEFAHQLFILSTFVTDEAGEISYHPCVIEPQPEACGDFTGPVADYLRQFWWEHKEGFGAGQVDDEPYSGLYRIIDDSGAFVSEYAATNALEDFAETFTAAVFDEYPIYNREGKIVTEKLDFFLKDGGPYTELVKQIRSNFYETFEIWSANDLYTNMSFTNRLVKEAKEELGLEWWLIRRLRNVL